jgi:hypothetical protein
MSAELSTLRAELRDTQQQLLALLEGFLGREPLLPGSLYTLRRRCGKPNCRCAHGELHASTVLSYRGPGGPQNITPSPEQLPAVRRLTDDYRRFRQARTKWLRLQRQMLTLLDRIEAARVRQGEREFQQGHGPAPSRTRTRSSSRSRS